MYLTSEVKTNIFEKHGFAKTKTDTGSPEAQIALLSFRIAHLTEHLKKNKHDFSTELGLKKLVGKRKRLLKYLARKDIQKYRDLIDKLGIRK